MRTYFKVIEAEKADGFYQLPLGQDMHGQEWVLTTNNVPASELHLISIDAKHDGELIARLLNWYYNEDEADAILEQAVPQTARERG